jgi:hypothetical protein
MILVFIKPKKYANFSHPAVIIIANLPKKTPITRRHKAA